MPSHGWRMGLSNVTTRVWSRGKSLTGPRVSHLTGALRAPNREPMNGMATAAAATAPSPYVSQPRNERRPMLGSPEGDGAGGLETGSMAPPSLTLKSSFAAGRRAPPPGRQQRHQVIDLRRAQ